MHARAAPSPSPCNRLAGPQAGAARAQVSRRGAERTCSESTRLSARPREGEEEGAHGAFDLVGVGAAMRPMLLRRYVEHALYARQHGYFAAKHVVGGLRSSQPLPYAELRDEDHYRRTVRERTETGADGSAWLTPSETFTPHYGEAVARSIVERHRVRYPDGTPLQLLEVGGGNGTFARDVLTYLRRDEPELYSSCRYMVVEISAALHAAQRTCLGEALGDEHLASRVELVNDDARTWAAARPGSLTGPWNICMLEVLDNLGHDRLRVTQPRGGDPPVLQQAVVHCLDEENGFELPSDAGGQVSSDASFAARSADAQGGERALWQQNFEPLTDTDLLDVSSLLGLTSLDALVELRAEVAAAEGAGVGASLASDVQSFFGSLLGESGRDGVADTIDVHVPTGSWRLLSALCAAAPTHEFTMADFSWLPPQPDGAIGAPVVQVQRAGTTIDLRGDYLRACGDADILFPTNFGHLATMVDAASRASRGAGGAPPRPAATLSTAEFMRRWHTAGATRTASGFDPLTDDFANTAFLLSSADAE